MKTFFFVIGCLILAFIINLIIKVFKSEDEKYVRDKQIITIISLTVSVIIIELMYRYWG